MRVELSFKRHLQEQERKAPRKGDRTRIRIRIAAIEVLDRAGYHRMRISDISEAAGISPASLYQYYSDKLEIALAVLDEFDTFFAICQNAGFGGPAPSHYDAIHRSNLRFLEIVQQNAGIMRCLLQVADDERVFAERFYATSRAQNQRIALGLLKRMKATSSRLPAITLVVYSLGAMMDEIARRLLVQRDPLFREIANAVAPDTATLATLLSEIWYRALYAADYVEGDGFLATALGSTKARAPTRGGRSKRPTR